MKPAIVKPLSDRGHQVVNRYDPCVGTCTPESRGQIQVFIRFAGFARQSAP
jgi:hypothetical protein